MCGWPEGGAEGILLGKFSRHQRFKLGSLRAVAVECIQISWHSPHSSSKWIPCSKNTKLNIRFSGSPYIFGSDAYPLVRKYRRDMHLPLIYKNSVSFDSSVLLDCVNIWWCYVVVVVFKPSLVFMPQSWNVPHLSQQALSHVRTTALSCQGLLILPH